MHTYINIYIYVPMWNGGVRYQVKFLQLSVNKFIIWILTHNYLSLLNLCKTIRKKQLN